MAKLLALDLDGTTFGVGTSIPEINLLRMRQARQAGHKICFVSGRKNFNQLEELFTICDYFILNNGGTAYQMPQQKLLFQALVRREDLLEMISCCNQLPDTALHLIGEGYWGVNCRTSELPKLEKRYSNRAQIYKSAADLPFETVDGFLVSGDCAGVRVYIDCKGLKLSYVMSEPDLMDVMPAGVNKWSGICKVAKLAGIALEDIIAAGNYFNDLDMITGAPLGVAVQNSPDEVKAQADFVTSRTNLEGAVAEIIERFLL
ncbi:MAG: HAD family phosphatase [Anaerotruncus sp.]|jgi:Cof subfamily protein (haloacid dehalogenase superfamily)|nr:HAD family phosphatase [Anaerotruncus sp.]